VKPYFSLPFLGEFHSNTTLMTISFFLCLALAFYYLRFFLSSYKIITLLIVTSWLSFIGARLFHVFLERPRYFIENPELIFARFDGMTFYGSFITGFLVLWMFSKIWQIKTENKRHYWDFSALSLVLTYTIMRLGCFANGCCWGKISANSWAVQYFDSRTVMPAVGIPVHPVQLYDVAHGIFMLLILILMRRESYLLGRHVFVVCLVYPLGRFWTEFYRGDSFRGEDIIWGLSTSQLISVLVFIIGLYGLRKKQTIG
jgi:phosphatidylglycerol---prolipoprotein diacylglyceryl transferase